MNGNFDPQKFHNLSLRCMAGISFLSDPCIRQRYTSTCKVDMQTTIVYRHTVIRNWRPNQNNGIRQLVCLLAASFRALAFFSASIDVHRSRGRLNSTLLSPQNPKKAGSMHAVCFLIKYPTTFLLFSALFKITLTFGLQNNKQQEKQKTLS